MRQVSIIRDVFRQTPLAISIDTDGTVVTKALNEYGKSIIGGKSVVGDIGKIRLPDGVSATEFKTISPSMEKLIFGDSSDATDESSGEISVDVISKHVLSGKTFTSRSVLRESLFGSIGNVSISGIKTKSSKRHAINYKARSFRKFSTISSASKLLVKTSPSYNRLRNTYVSGSKKTLRSISADLLLSSIGEGNIRRFLMPHKSAARISVEGGRRLNRRFRHPSDEGTSFKSDSQRIYSSILAKMPGSWN